LKKTGDAGAFVPERRTDEKGLLMTTEDPKNSVHDEQFDADEKELESTGKETDKKNDEATPADDAAVKPDVVTEVTDDTAAKGETPAAAEEVTEETAPEAAGEAEEAEPEGETPATAEEVTEETAPEAAGEAEEAEPEGETPAAAEEVTEETAPEAAGEAEEGESEEETLQQEDEDQDKPEDKDESGEKSGDEEQDKTGEKDGDEEMAELPPVDYSGFSRKELVETLALIVENRPPAEITDDVARIKEFFYKKTKTEFNEARLNYAKEGGNIDDYRPEPDELEVRIKSILEVYRHRKTDFNRVQESEKQENLRKKLEIIEQIKDLVNREEAINKTFQEFRNLQNEWHTTGIVPQSALKDLWENYHHSVEIFYDYIKINRELRDLDLKKNLEAKIILCEKAEELLTEPNAITAFKLLQEYHDQWREIGPVPHENKNDVWERFREATSRINKRHHEYFETQKDEQRQNLEAKTALCEKVEEIAGSEILTFADFREKSDAIIEYQKQWRTLGFAPKKHNNKIYQRFRTACDSFFEKKRAFFAESKETQMHNLQLKTELCLKAEALQESTDWKDTSDMLIRLQKEWKEIGPVPRKYSEKIWKRFRKACDTFFTRKSEFVAGRDTSYEDNLQAKLALLEELEAFDPGDDDKAAFEKLREIQKNWMEIGYVPIDKKDEIARRYKDALNKQFDRLKLDDEDKNILRYRSKVDSARSNPRAARKVRAEREKFYGKIKQLENDIVLWENNIGFFAKSVNADNMIREVEEKIAEAKKNIKILEEKMKLIDSSIDE